jgi:type II secretory pathway component GspD/PulD (secretin)
VSLTALESPASFVLADLAVMLEVSMTIPNDLGGKLVSVEFEDVDGQAAVEEVARMVGHRAMRSTSGVISFVPEDKALKDFVVVRPGAETLSDATEGLRAVLGAAAVVSKVGERLVVVGEPAALDRAQEFEAHLEGGADGWVVEVKVFSMTRSWQRQAGIEWGIGGGVGAGFDAAAGNRDAVRFPVFGARAAFAVDALLRASEEGREVVLARSGRVFLLEGTSAKMQQGDVVLIPRRTVSDNGTVTTTGHDRIETGFGLTVSGQRVVGGIRLDVSARLSTVNGFVGELPITGESSTSAIAMLADGDWLLLSGLSGSDRERRSVGVPFIDRIIGGSDESGARDVDVVLALQARRVMSSDALRERAFSR